MRRNRPLVTALASVSLLGLAAPAFADAAPPSDGGSGTTTAPAVTVDFERKVLTTGLENPFEVLYGPGGKLWLTERTAGRVTQVDPATGEKTTILTIDEVLATAGEQDGLLGMALHPDLLKDNKKNNQYVYLSYTYDGGGTGPAGEELDRRQRIVRYIYDAKANTLVDPTTLIEGMPASDDHNSGRLVFGPDKTLYYTIGDRGNNQDLNAYKPNEAQRLPTQDEVDAQDWTAYQGKTLRLNLDGSIPKDNPKLDGVKSHVFTYGHRNAQGLTFANGKLYSSEQGPKGDDELNLLKAGGNYGWPYVSGYKDDSAYVFGDWSAGTTLPYDGFNIPDEVPQYAEHDFTAANFVEPLRTYFTVADNHDFKGDACDPSGLYFICYPTIAPSSLDHYDQTAIPGWEDSLLMPTLKSGELFRVQLTEDGEKVGESQRLFRSVNRYRDTATSPDGATIIVATDSGGLARGTDGDSTTELENPGALLTFTYTGN
ncbi:glucose/sorbosone family PQQ-dependent dehydrogenase [Georgenia sp. SYP-B2076]|uniref:glucose/sorbosone family PQQ-dependent dehydrogenase n=1 Tax=Georgenia sp. SYP-B2076 TaxID=2495881 RepID=UPI000F8D5B7C|nr:glucose/sorbosone family PQQ-dependent dehydrogenase [Georgenia sp. SYP-B2076]